MGKARTIGHETHRLDRGVVGKAQDRDVAFVQHLRALRRVLAVIADQGNDFDIGTLA
jgi:hypothetical protein